MPDDTRTPPDGQDVLKQLRRLSRRGFAAYAASMAGIVCGIGWVGTRAVKGGIPWPLRFMQEANESLWSKVFGAGGLAPEFPRSRARNLRPNGSYGLLEGSEWMADWRLRVHSDEGIASELTLSDLRALPRVEQVTEFKCIEGWSEVVAWAGCRFSDLAEMTGKAGRHGKPNGKLDPNDLYPYVGLSTVDGGYFVGLDMASALHPQTLLAYEMNGEALPMEHGAPLRLVIPVKYGIKNIKQLGEIRFTDQRPPDYWAERGYDWYAGL